jgi:hypothetical protein
LVHRWRSREQGPPCLCHQRARSEKSKTLLTDDAVLAQQLLNDRVVSDRNALAVDFGVSPLVDQFSDCLQVNLAVGDVWLNKLEHLLGSLGDSDKDTVVDLEETEELEDLLWLGGNLGDTDRVRRSINRKRRYLPL